MPIYKKYNMKTRTNILTYFWQAFYTSFKATHTEIKTILCSNVHIAVMYIIYIYSPVFQLQKIYPFFLEVLLCI